MAAAIELRTDFGTDALRRLAKASRDAKQTWRVMALASINHAVGSTEAARIGGGGLQIVRDCVVGFNAESPAGMLDCKAPGQTPRFGPRLRSRLWPRLWPDKLTAFGRVAETGQKPCIDGAVRWRLVDLVAWLYEEVGNRQIGAALRVPDLIFEPDLN
ncbi:MAG: hypothetical protein AAF844_10190 [Pseudomonadota bacterium]